MRLPTTKKDLLERWNSGELFEFFLFYGHKPPFQGVDASCLSQWFERDFRIDDIEYSTAEHWMMAEKARLFNDDQMLEAILDSQGPREAKALGRKVRDFDQATWEQHRFEIVRRGNYAKFKQNKDMKEFLLSTAEYSDKLLGKVAEPREDYVVPSKIERVTSKSVKGDLEASNVANSNVILVEAAGRDVIWGIGYGVNNPLSRDPTKWRGRNLLGFALTVVRDDLLLE